MVERHLSRFEGSKAIGFSEGQFQAVVQTLDHTAGNLLPGPKPVQQQGPVLARHTSYPLHRLKARAQGPRRPAVQEFPRPEGRAVVPEELEVLLEQAGADGFQIVAQQLRQLDFLLLGQVLGALQQAPAAMRQYRFSPLSFQGPGFLGSHRIHRLVHMPRHVEAVRDVECLSGLARNHLQAGLPQIAADEAQPRLVRQRIPPGAEPIQHPSHFRPG